MIRLLARCVFTGILILPMVYALDYETLTEQEDKNKELDMDDIQQELMELSSECKQSIIMGDTLGNNNLHSLHILNAKLDSLIVKLK